MRFVPKPSTFGPLGNMWAKTHCWESVVDFVHLMPVTGFRFCNHLAHSKRILKKRAHCNAATMSDIKRTSRRPFEKSDSLTEALTGLLGSGRFLGPKPLSITLAAVG